MPALCKLRSSLFLNTLGSSDSFLQDYGKKYDDKDYGKKYDDKDYGKKYDEKVM